MLTNSSQPAVRGDIPGLIRAIAWLRPNSCMNTEAPASRARAATPSTCSWVNAPFGPTGPRSCSPVSPASRASRPSS